MSGNLVLVSHLSVGLVLQLACAGLAICNERRSAAIRTDSQEPSVEKSLLSRGMVGPIIRSPGIFRYAMSVCFMAHAVEQLASEGLSHTSASTALAFALLGIGSFFVGREINKPTPQRGANPCTFADKAKTCLSTGALYWGVADVLIGLQGALQKAPTELLLSPLFVVAISCAAASISSVLMLGTRAQVFPVPMLLNALTNLSFAAANFVHLGAQEAKVSIAIGMWGIGSLCLAADRRNALITSAKIATGPNNNEGE